MPTGPVTEKSEIQFYVAKDTRTLDKESITHFESQASKFFPSLHSRVQSVGVGLAFAPLVYVGFLWLATVIAEHNTKSPLTPQVSSVVVELGLALIVIIAYVYWAHITLSKLNTQFAKMDTRWKTGVNGIFDPNSKRAMKAIVACMDEYEEFNAWFQTIHRATTVVYLLWGYGLSFVTWLLWSALVKPSWLQFSDLIWKGKNLEILGGVSQLEFLTIFVVAVFVPVWVSMVRSSVRRHTARRNPTLQLCVMLNARDRDAMPAARTATSASSSPTN